MNLNSDAMVQVVDGRGDEGSGKEPFTVSSVPMINWLLACAALLPY